MSDSLRTLLRRYERAQQAADRLSRELASAIRERIRTGRRGEASRCAEELGWDRRRLADWMKRAGRGSTSALTGEEAPGSGDEDSSTGTEPNGGDANGS